MLPNTITLPVDEANNATIVNETIVRFEELQNRSIYTGENHTLATRDNVTFYRTSPKVSGNFRGVAKTSVKFSRDMAILGVDGATISAPLILEVSFSVPVGVTAAQTLLARQRAIALLDLDAVMAPFNDQLMI